jgi:hypothetical protein
MEITQIALTNSANAFCLLLTGKYNSDVEGLKWPVIAMFFFTVKPILKPLDTKVALEHQAGCNLDSHLVQRPDLATLSEQTDV